MTQILCTHEDSVPLSLSLSPQPLFPLVDTEGILACWHSLHLLLEEVMEAAEVGSKGKAKAQS